MSGTYHEISGGGRIPSGLPGGFFIYEADDTLETIIFADINVIRMYGCNTFEEFCEFTGGSFRGMVHPDDLYKIQNQIQAQTSYGQKRHDYVRYRIQTRSGEVRYAEDFGHLLHWVNGKSFFYVFIVDVNQDEYYNRYRNSIAEEEVLLANHDIDPLTGLFNMSFFYHKVQMILSSPEGRRRDQAIVHFDIPNFKLYNERFGFSRGDDLLCELTRVIRESFAGAVCSRFSDDHFVVFTPDSRESVIEKVHKVCRAMIRSEDITKKVRLKAGIYIINDRQAEIGLACDHARLACNSIKELHDRVYCIYDDMMRDRMRRQQYVVDNIEKALREGYIKVFYQPVVRVSSGEICGYEALVRWKDPDIGLLSPSDFVETLEQYHLIHLVDQYVVRRVCEDYIKLSEAGETVVPVSVNLSRLDFELCDIFGIIEEIRAEYDVPRNMLDLEITESALSDNEGRIKYECADMKELGYQIWLDDFGSGYSSLNTVAEYPFDVLKLDLVFLRGMDRNPKTATLMRYIAAGADAVGVSTLCEGVETDAHYEFLKEIGCNMAQGYYFAKPMPMEESRIFTKGKGLTWEKR